MSEHAFDLHSPVIIATCLYFIASLFAAIEYYFSTNVSSLTSSASSTRLPSNHSHQINLEKQTRRPSLPSRKDPLDIGESMHSIGMRLPPPPSIPNLKRTPGEENRRLFYKYLLLSLVLRLIFLPVEEKFISTNNTVNSINKTLDEESFNQNTVSNNEITVIVSQTLPTLTSIAAFAILICFYAQVTFIASGRIRTYSNNNNTNNTTVMNSNNNNRHIKVLKWMQQSSTQIIFTIYAALIFFTNVIPAITNQWFEMWVWILLCVYHLILFISMTYFGITLNSVLKTNITSDLGLRLIGMCVICSVTFLMRSILEGFLVFRTCHKSVIAPFIAQTSSDIDVSKAGAWNGSFGRDVTGYLLLEWFPAIVVLILMHRSSNDRNSDASHSHGNTVSTATRSRYFQYDDSVNAMEGGELNLSHNPQGINRSHSANGSVPVSISTTRATMTQQQKGTNSSNPTQRTMTTSFGMIRTLSGAAGVIGTGRSETTALLGERSHSAVSGMSNQSYGISQTED